MSRSKQIVRSLVMVAMAAVVTMPAALAQGRIDGTIVDENGDPIAGAMVKVESQGVTDVREETADSNGRFLMLGLGSGAWTLSVSADGYRPHAATIQVRQGRNSPIETVLERTRSNLELRFGEEAFEGLDAEEIEREVEAATEAYTARNWDAAIAGFRSVLEKLPQASELWLYVGAAHRAQGENEEALAAFERLLVADPTHETVETEIARTKLLMGDLSAVSELEAAASGPDATREDLFNLGEFAFVKGEFDAAVPWYEKAATLDPNWVLPPYKLGLIALNRGDTEAATQFFETVIAIDPNSDEAAQARATLDALP